MDYLIEKHERDAAERPGAGKRARAVIAFVELAQRIEAGVTAVERQIELIRAMDKPTAKRFLKGTKRMLKSLETLSAAEAPEVIEARVEALESTRSSTDLGANHDDLTSSVPEAPEAPQISPPPILEPQGVDVRPPDPIVEQARNASVEPVRADVGVPDEASLALLSQLDAIQDMSEAVNRALDLANEVLTEAQLGQDEQHGIAIKRLESLLDSVIGETNMTTLDADDEYIASLIAKYINATQKALMSSRIVNAACAWAYWRGAPLEDIAHLRGITKPGAKGPDVHNSVAAVKQGILRANRMVLRPENPADGTTRSPESVAELDEKGSREVTAETSELMPAEPTLDKENYEEEPDYVRLANDLLSALNFGEDFRRAAEELLNPNAKTHQLSDNKLDIIRKIRKLALIRNSKGKDIFGEFEECSVFARKDDQAVSRATARTRQFVGLFWQNGRIIEKSPLTIAQQSSTRNAPSDRTRFIGDFNAGIEALIERINARKSTEAERPEFTFGNK